jgi:hypothetical protein
VIRVSSLTKSPGVGIALASEALRFLGADWIIVF